MHVVTSKTSHMFVTSAHDQTKISAKHHLPLRQNDFPSQRLPFSPWHHTAPNRWQSPRICHLHAKVAHDILLHRGDIRLRKRETRKRETSAHLEPRYYEADSTLNKVKAQEVDPQFQAGLPDCLNQGVR